VNGAGEMADRFWICGSGPGKITFIKVKGCQRGVDSAIAVEELISILLKESDGWIEPEPVISEGRVVYEPDRQITRHSNPSSKQAGVTAQEMADRFNISLRTVIGC